MNSFLTLETVSKRFDNGFTTLSRINFSVKRGEFVSIVGASGSGKTTLLRLVAGLDKPSSGSLKVPPNVRASYVFQDAHLLSWRTALENVELPLEFEGVAKTLRRQRAAEMLASVKLSDFGDAYPQQLSGGMRMRVSLARALVTEPELLLLDEPFAAVDELTRNELNEELYRLWLQKNMTVIFVTHSFSDAVFLSQRVLMLSKKSRSLGKEIGIELPKQRTRALRTEGAFLKKVHEVSESFEAIGGARE